MIKPILSIFLNYESISLNLMISGLTAPFLTDLLNHISTVISIKLNTYGMGMRNIVVCKHILASNVIFVFTSVAQVELAWEIVGLVLMLVEAYFTHHFDAWFPIWHESVGT